MEQAITTATGAGLERLVEYGLLGIIAAIGLGFILWTAYKCSTTTKEGLDNNTKAISDLTIVMTRLDARLDK